MTPPASPRLPEAVVDDAALWRAEAAMSEVDDMAGPEMNSDYRRVEMLRAALKVLRPSILAYGAARERQGIERAARFLDTLAAGMKNLEEARVGVSVAAEHLRALPVDGATP